MEKYCIWWSGITGKSVLSKIKYMYSDYVVNWRVQRYLHMQKRNDPKECARNAKPCNQDCQPQSQLKLAEYTNEQLVKWCWERPSQAEGEASSKEWGSSPCALARGLELSPLKLHRTSSICYQPKAVSQGSFLYNTQNITKWLYSVVSGKLEPYMGRSDYLCLTIKTSRKLQ